MGVGKRGALREKPGTEIDIWGIFGYVGRILDSKSRYSVYISRQGLGQMSHKSKDIARATLLEPRASYGEIASRFGVSRQRVGAIVRRLSVGRGAARRSNRRIQDAG